MAWTWCFWGNTPFCLAWWFEKFLLPVAVATVVATFAVWQIKRKRSADYASEQLAKFYAPMLGKLSELAAHRKFDELVTRSNEEAHSHLLRLEKDRPIDSDYVREAQATSEQVMCFFEETLPN